MDSKKTILITGSSKGLGEQLARKFSNKGHNIIIHGRDVRKLELIKNELVNKGVGCKIVTGDLTEKETIETLAAVAESENVDILINNAAIYKKKLFGETTEKEIRNIFEINLIAPILITRHLFPYFQKKQSGLILNINSFAGKNSGDGESIYCASKHGLRGFSGSLQFDANRAGIRVIEVYIGAMNTQMVAGRKDIEKCISTSDAADLILNLCDEYKSMRISEVDLLRRIY